MEWTGRVTFQIPRRPTRAIFMKAGLNDGIREHHGSPSYHQMCWLDSGNAGKNWLRNELIRLGGAKIMNRRRIYRPATFISRFTQRMTRFESISGKVQRRRSDEDKVGTTTCSSRSEWKILSRSASNEEQAMNVSRYITTGWGKIFAHFSIGCQNSRKRAIEVWFAPKDAQENAIFGSICEPAAG